MSRSSRAIVCKKCRVKFSGTRECPFCNTPRGSRNPKSRKRSVHKTPQKKVSRDTYTRVEKRRISRRGGRKSKVLIKILTRKLK